jgi:O-acetyl-ADP-ribose deacetylase (regulator of RNase III)
MATLEQLNTLNTLLLGEMPQYRDYASTFHHDIQSQWKLFRSLVNIREPKPASVEFLKIQDELLQSEISTKGITDIANFIPMHDNIYLWQGDITTLKVDGIINAANSDMTGCYCPLHGCIDNAIHTFAGVQLRLECSKLMKQQGYQEPTGQAKITRAYNLPSKYIIHTVGPIVSGKVTKKDCELLASCYRSCLEIAEQNELNSLAFCCISTGEFHFPNKIAAEIAIETVSKYLSNHISLKIVFNVFKDTDFKIYEHILRQIK